MAAVYGQTITGDLVINVTDPSGAVVSGAAVSLTNVETDVKLTALADVTGTNLFSELKPGRYQLEVTAPGFQKAIITDIAIALGQRAHVDAKLTVGAVNDNVNVSAAAESLLTAEGASIGR